MGLINASKEKGGFGLYSRFALSLIPEGTIITGSMGLVGHQGPVDEDSKVMTGGATQLFVAEAVSDVMDSSESIYITDIDALDNDNLVFSKGLRELGLLSSAESESLSELRAAFSRFQLD